MTTRSWTQSARAMCLGETGCASASVIGDAATRTPVGVTGKSTAPSSTGGLASAPIPATAVVRADSVAPLLTYRQAAQLLGVTDRTVWSLVDRGVLPVVRFGRSVRIDPADLRAFIERSKNGGAA